MNDQELAERLRRSTDRRGFVTLDDVMLRVGRPERSTRPLGRATKIAPILVAAGVAAAVAAVLIVPGGHQAKQRIHFATQPGRSVAATPTTAAPAPTIAPPTTVAPTTAAPTTVAPVPTTAPTMITIPESSVSVSPSALPTPTLSPCVLDAVLSPAQTQALDPAEQAAQKEEPAANVAPGPGVSEQVVVDDALSDESASATAPVTVSEMSYSQALASLPPATPSGYPVFSPVISPDRCMWVVHVTAPYAVKIIPPDGKIPPSGLPTKPSYTAVYDVASGVPVSETTP